MSAPTLTPAETPVVSSPRGFVKSLWRSSAATVLWLPASVVGLAGSLIGLHQPVARLQRKLVAYGSGKPPVAAKRGPLSVLAYCLLGIPLGALALFIANFATLNTIRCVFLYGFFDGGSTENAWGGPTLFGAWVVHAVLAVVLFPAWLGLLWLLARLQSALADSLLGLGRGGWMAVPAAVLFAAAGTVWLIAWSHQI